jgi:hypothetical protein
MELAQQPPVVLVLQVQVVLVRVMVLVATQRW